MAKQTKKGKITALYERLSHDDERAGECVSIENQKQILEDYAHKHGFQNIRHFTDDGVRGTTFKRPDLDAMLEEIRAGNVAMVIIKDQSCIGRDVVEVGLLKRTFHKYNIRFIATNDNLDTANRFDIISIFRDVINEWYLRDLSRKQRTAIRIKGESGKPTTNSAIYGYKKDPDDKHHWLVDEEAAAVVRRIFRLTIEGKGSYDIARILFDDHMETPAVYAAKKGIEVWKSKEEFPNPYNWSGYIVGQILSKPEYMGHTVNFRSHKESYKDKNAVQNPKEDWLIFENTHEAIVDKETWKLAQKLRKTPRRHDTLSEANPLMRLLFCADCGAKMTNHHSRGGTKNNPYPSDCYKCSTYTQACQKQTTACCGHYIRTKVLRELILNTIRTASTFAISNQEAFLKESSFRFSNMAERNIES